MAEERIRILQMLQEQKITVEEAERLLAVLTKLDETEAPGKTGRAHRRHGDRQSRRSHGPSHHSRDSHGSGKRSHHHHQHSGHHDFFDGIGDWAEGFADYFAGPAEDFAGDMANWAENFAADFADDCSHLAGDCADIAADIADMDIAGRFEDFGPFRPPMPPRAPRPPRPSAPSPVRRRILMHRGDPGRHGKRGRRFTPGWDIRASELTTALQLLGHEDVCQDEIDKLRRHDVTPEYIQALYDAGLEEATIGELVGLRIFETEPDYVRQMRGYFPDHALKAVIHLSKYGVDPDYVASLFDAGLTDLSPGKVVALSAYNLDPADIKAAWEKDPTLSPRQIYQAEHEPTAATESPIDEEIEPSTDEA